jgi:hypothetical protein
MNLAECTKSEKATHTSKSYGNGILKNVSALSSRLEIVMNMCGFLHLSLFQTGIRMKATFTQQNDWLGTHRVHLIWMCSYPVDSCECVFFKKPKKFMS